ncbi:hypothetical protein RDI58_022338 [Solanum bulbocastanum]|uniref:NB-ARC domain-containing protein n=1 Tax=Solanum bulbocastanum TaxID=147425 RepID=A0AAN8T5L2_SOLBU
MKDLFTLAEDISETAAYLSILCCETYDQYSAHVSAPECPIWDRQDVNPGPDFESKISKLLERINPIRPEWWKLYISVLKASHSSVPKAPLMHGGHKNLSHDLDLAQKFTKSIRYVLEKLKSHDASLKLEELLRSKLDLITKLKPQIVLVKEELLIVRSFFDHTEEAYDENDEICGLRISATEMAYEAECCENLKREKIDVNRVAKGSASIVPSLSANTSGANEEMLATELRHVLLTKRFLILIDDEWDTTAWDYLNMCFQGSQNRSRIILTTRLYEVAHYAKCNSEPHPLRLLTDEESWKLLQRELFHGQSFPSKLGDVGLRIAKRCGDDIAQWQWAGSSVRSLLYNASSDDYYPAMARHSSFIFNIFKLVKVLNLESINIGDTFPNEFKISNSYEILRSMSNLRKLKCIVEGLLGYSTKGSIVRFPRLDFLHQLESLKLFSYSYRAKHPHEFNFPSKLRELTLSNFRLPSTQILTVLKLLFRAFEGAEWEVKDSDFPELKYLKYDNLNIA